MTINWTIAAKKTILLRCCSCYSSRLIGWRHFSSNRRRI